MYTHCGCGHRELWDIDLDYWTQLFHVLYHASFFLCLKRDLDGQIFLKMFGKLFQSKKPENLHCSWKRYFRGCWGDDWNFWGTYMQIRLEHRLTTNLKRKVIHSLLRAVEAFIYGFNCLKNCTVHVTRFLSTFSTMSSNDTHMGCPLQKEPI